MGTRRFSFTAARLDAVQAPTAGAIQVYDSTTPGLAMRVTKAGARTFVLFRRIHGRPVRMKLGSVGSMSIPDARKAAQQIAGKAAAGADVVAERAAARLRGRTVGDAFEAWLSVAKHRKRSWEDDKRLWEIWLKQPLGRRVLAEVSTGELERSTQRIGQDHPRTANKCRALLSTIWNHAMRRGETATNPVRFVERFPEHSRERYLKETELQAFLLAVAAEPPTWRDYFLLALLTGQRRENLSRMRWEEIDLASGVWNIPAAKSKSKHATMVPLTDLAMGLLQRRRAEIAGEWVFPSYVGSKDGCVREPRKPWLRILKRAGIPDLRVHDLRRSVGTWLGAAGTNSYTIAKALGHQSVRSGEVYVRLGADPVRDAMHAIQQARPLLDVAVQSARGLDTASKAEAGACSAVGTADKEAG
jgi:integrase